MKILPCLYITAWLIPAIVAVLYFAGLISGEGILANNAKASYMLNTLSVVLNMMIAYLSLKLFAFPFVKKRLGKEDENHNGRLYKSLSVARLVILQFAIITDLIVWYLLANSSTLYLVGIILVVLLFCVPRRTEPSSMN